MKLDSSFYPLIFGPVFLIIILQNHIVQTLRQDWQPCYKFGKSWCGQMCGITILNPHNPSNCLKSGFCSCPRNTTLPPHCHEPSSFDYFEIDQCRRLEGFCKVPVRFKRSNTLRKSHRYRTFTDAQDEPPYNKTNYVCTDFNRIQLSREDRPLKYCVCFP